MNDIWLPIILAVIAAIPGLLGLWRQLRKDSVDAASQYAQMLSDEIVKRRECECKVDELEDQIEMLEKEIKRKGNYTRRLKAQLELSGIEPVGENGEKRYYKSDNV